MGPAILVLFGLTIDIIGAFILAVEAIGVERVREWGERLTEVFKASKLWSSGRPGIIFWSLLFVPGWYTVATLVPETSALQKVLLLTGVMIFAVTGTYLIGLAGSRFGIALLAVQAGARRGAAGLLGFGMLATGFLLQFAGTMWQVLQSSS